MPTPDPNPRGLKSYSIFAKTWDRNPKNSKLKKIQKSKKPKESKKQGIKCRLSFLSNVVFKLSKMNDIFLKAREYENIHSRMKCFKLETFK